MYKLNEKTHVKQTEMGQTLLYASSAINEKNNDNAVWLSNTDHRQLNKTLDVISHFRIHD